MTSTAKVAGVERRQAEDIDQPMRRIGESAGDPLLFQHHRQKPRAPVCRSIVRHRRITCVVAGIFRGTFFHNFVRRCAHRSDTRPTIHSTIASNLS